MCDPGSIILGAQVAGAGMSAIGAMGDATAQKIGLRAQARIADINAGQSMEAARRAIEVGNFEESAARLRTGQLKSQQRTAMAAGGVALDEGTAANVLTSTDYMGEVDALTINQNAVRRAGELRMQGANYRGEAIQARAAARGISPLMAGATSLLGSAGQVAGSWYSMSKSGALGGSSGGGGGSSNWRARWSGDSY